MTTGHLWAWLVSVKPYKFNFPFISDLWPWNGHRTQQKGLLIGFKTRNIKFFVYAAFHAYDRKGITSSQFKIDPRTCRRFFTTPGKLTKQSFEFLCENFHLKWKSLFKCLRRLCGIYYENFPPELVDVKKAEKNWALTSWGRRMEWNETYQILNNRKCNVNVFRFFFLSLLQFVCSGKMRMVSILSSFSDSISHTYTAGARLVRWSKKSSKINLSSLECRRGNFHPAKRTRK